MLTVATIGLAQLLGGLAIYLPTWLDAPAFIPRVPTTLTDTTFNVDPVTFTGNDLLLLAVVPIVLAALTWFLLRTDAGMAVRGMAENMDRARLLGIPVNQLSLLLWSVAGGLAALTVVLRAPTEGVPLTAVAGPTVLLPGAGRRRGRRACARWPGRSSPPSSSACSTSSCCGTSTTPRPRRWCCWW